MLAGVTDCRRSWKWGCRGRLALGFKPRLAAMGIEDQTVLEEKGEDHAVLEGKGEDHTALVE